MIPVPGTWKLVAAGIGVLGLVALLGTAAAVIDKHGYDKATAVLQPRLDKANAAIGTLTAANDANLQTIATMTADAAANDALVEQYAAQQAADTQKAADAAAAIRKLQSDDQTVAAICALLFLLPCAACSLTPAPEVTLVPQTRVVRQLPPIELVQPCTGPRAPLQTTGDLLADDQAAHAALKACAGKVDRLAAWRKASAR